ncbi:hypothetical protein tloyanaT_13290 [Thalassotalea loyana]|uniref:Uncharacterized protein n=1 Tax=Thalassotalea loyana TaxID=280483 RepID=A0ABQ6HAC4_9GAMM|nr:hypothetical protein [Thalassotalea loyana]GLX85077.1 hypothetical protein tloyanaT_13290 [Thalassotalea loyana]
MLDKKYLDLWHGGLSDNGGLVLVIKGDDVQTRFACFVYEIEQGGLFYVMPHYDDPNGIATPEFSFIEGEPEYFSGADCIGVKTETKEVYVDKIHNERPDEIAMLARWRDKIDDIDAERERVRIRYSNEHMTLI